MQSTCRYDRTFALEGINGVVHDDTSGFQLLVDAIRQKGYKKIGCFLPDIKANITYLRENAIKEAMQEYHLEVKDKWFIHEANDLGFVEVGRRSARKVMEMKERPEIIIAVSDPIAIGAISWFQENGWTVPADIAITGYGDNEIRKYLHPLLTTVNLNVKEIINKSVNAMLEQFHKNNEITQKILVSPLLVKGNSI